VPREKVFSVEVVKVYRGSRATEQLILNLGTRWRCMVNLTPQPLYHREGSPVPIAKEISCMKMRDYTCGVEEVNWNKIAQDRVK